MFLVLLVFFCAFIDGAPACASESSRSTITEHRSSKALRPGDYNYTDNRKEFDEIQQFEETADQNIALNSDWSTFRLRNSEHREPKLRFEQISEILKAETQKNSLYFQIFCPYKVIVPTPSLQEYADGCMKIIQAFKPSLNQLGYKRIIVTTFLPGWRTTYRAYLLADLRYARDGSRPGAPYTIPIESADDSERKLTAQHLKEHGLLVNWEGHTLPFCSRWKQRAS